MRGIQRAGLLMVGAALFISGAAVTTAQSPSAPAGAADFEVWAPLSGNLGDKSFMDSANRGSSRRRTIWGSRSR